MVFVDKPLEEAKLTLKRGQQCLRWRHRLHKERYRVLVQITCLPSGRRAQHCSRCLGKQELGKFARSNNSSFFLASCSDVPVLQGRCQLLMDGSYKEIFLLWGTWFKRALDFLAPLWQVPDTVGDAGNSKCWLFWRENPGSAVWATRGS